MIILNNIKRSNNNIKRSRIERIEQQQAINKALDETKNNIKKATDEARRDIPHYTQLVNE